MIEPNELYPAQMNGPVISAYGKALKDELSDADAIEDYLAGLSIQTASETELENIGRIVGYPRPLVPEAFAGENLLVLGSEPLIQDTMTGLARIGSSLGGELTAVAKGQANYMNLGLYRKFLDKVALLKRFGVTIQSVSKIAATISDRFTIEWDENHDIRIYYDEQIGYRNIWILTQLFYRVGTEPMVFAEYRPSGVEEEDE